MTTDTDADSEHPKKENPEGAPAGDVAAHVFIVAALAQRFHVNSEGNSLRKKRDRQSGGNSGAAVTVNRCPDSGRCRRSPRGASAGCKGILG
jgi:hypothetical protein